MTDRVAPRWHPLVMRGVSSAIETEHDSNARPGAPASESIRWRPRAYTGERPGLWNPGVPPGALPAPEPYWRVARRHMARILLVAVVLYAIVFAFP